MYVLFFLFFSIQYVKANEIGNILQKINEIKSMSFNFSQIIDNKKEKGDCILLFPDRLKCNYNDSKQKELIINKKRLSITQKRYDKTYHYPIKDSPFLKFLNKKKLKDIVVKSDMTILEDKLQLISMQENGKPLTIFFNKNNYNLAGWIINDQFNNNIIFLINITKLNENFSNEDFKIVY